MSRHATANAEPTDRLCQFVTDTEYDDLPTPVITHATKMILDTVGVTLAATDSDPAAVIRETYPDRYGTDGPARVLGTGETGTATDIAHLIGVTSHALDFDDVHQGMGGHPSAPVLSAALPIAERTGASGRDLLRSFVLGTEVELTLANVLNPGHYDRGWHPTAILGTMGAATAVGDLLELDAAERRQALGIAASKASGIKGNFGTMTKPLHVGDAARSGQEAATLAAGGFTASKQILELDFGGFCDLFEGDPGHEFDDHVDAFGDPWSLLDPPVGFKPYPCCGSTHAAIDAALALRDRHSVDPDEVESVRIRAHPRRLGHTDDPTPRTALDGKFSVQYCVTVALYDGDVWLDHFDDETVTSDPYQSFLERIEVERDPEAFADREWGGAVAVETSTDARSVTIDAPKGSAERPMTAAKLDEKYRRCASSILDRAAVDRSLELLRNLDAVDDLGDVIDELIA